MKCFHLCHPVLESQEKSRIEEKESFHGSLILMKEQRLYLIKIKKENLEVLEMRFFKVTFVLILNFLCIDTIIYPVSFEHIMIRMGAWAGLKITPIPRYITGYWSIFNSFILLFQELL